MIKIGVTGGIGSGKTTVCKHFESLGIPVYYADDRAKYILNNNEECKKSIILLFGESSYLENGNLNRAFISSHVFKDPKKVAKLNSIVHPWVAIDFNEWIKEHSKSNIIVKEAALLFETGANKTLDKIIVIDASEEVRIKRVLARDTHRSEQEVKEIIANQMPQEEMNKLADYLIVNNNGSMLNKVVEILNTINGKG